MLVSVKPELIYVIPFMASPIFT